MTRTRTRLDYSGRFSRINDTKSVKKRSTPSSGNFITDTGRRRKKTTIDRNSDKAISKDKVSFNHQPNCT